MNILVTGGEGQLGRALQRRSGGHAFVALGHAALDICDAAALATALDAHQPEIVINCAAYTSVDRAEAERDAAFAVNARGADHVAAACAERGIALLHVSTDHVFDGAATHPYREDDPVAPLGVYGASKAEGERAVLARGGAVVRTSWLFGRRGPSFVHAILAAARTQPVLRVVADQHGCPTYADHLAEALLGLAARPDRAGIYHYCDAGPTTRHAFAVEIVGMARRYERLACERIEAITTAEYPTAARRPAFSVMDTSRLRALGIAPRSWREGIAQVIDCDT